MAKAQIVDASIPQSGISKLRGLAEGIAVEEIAAPRVAIATERWLARVAQQASRRFPYRKTGRTATAIAGSAKVTGGTRFDTIRGYFYVDPAVAAHEYGARISPRRVQYLAIPIWDALRPDGTPKRSGPRAWKSMKTFVWTNKRTGRKYIVYSRKKKENGSNLVFLYVLVDMIELRATRTLRNTYDRMLPELYTEISTILRDSILKAYEARIKEAERKQKALIAAGRGKTALFRAYMQANPTAGVRLPSYDKYAPGLVPKYTR